MEMRCVNDAINTFHAIIKGSGSSDVLYDGEGGAAVVAHQKAGVCPVEISAMAMLRTVLQTS